MHIAQLTVLSKFSINWESLNKRNQSKTNFTEEKQVIQTKTGQVKLNSVEKVYLNFVRKYKHNQRQLGCTLHTRKIQCIFASVCA